MTAWISMIGDADADPTLRAALDFARTPHGTVDNVMRVHSHRPNTMNGHVVLYRAALHDDANTLATWLQETIASYVSVLNDCTYSYANHWKNAAHLIADPVRADAIEAALKARRPEDVFAEAELALLQYAEKLTTGPGTMVDLNKANYTPQHPRPAKRCATSHDTERQRCCTLGRTSHRTQQC